MPALKAIRNHIIFQFIDGVSTRDCKQFAEVTDWGFEVVRHTDSMEVPRWVDVIVVGHEAIDTIQPGMRVLVEALKWTEGFKFQGNEYWRTDLDSVLAIDEDVIPA